jgi:hypothetical protein
MLTNPTPGDLVRNSMGNAALMTVQSVSGAKALCTRIPNLTLELLQFPILALVLVRPASSLLTSTLNAPGVVSATPCSLVSILVTAPGSIGRLTVCDGSNLGDATVQWASGDGNVVAEEGALVVFGNAIVDLDFSALSAGQMMPFELQCSQGIAVIAMPTGASISVTYGAAY